MSLLTILFTLDLLVGRDWLKKWKRMSKGLRRETLAGMIGRFYARGLLMIHIHITIIIVDFSCQYVKCVMYTWDAWPPKVCGRPPKGWSISLSGWRSCSILAATTNVTQGMEICSCSICAPTMVSAPCQLCMCCSIYLHSIFMSWSWLFLTVANNITFKLHQ